VTYLWRALILVSLSVFAFAQEQSTRCGVTHLDRCLADLAKDQAGIFSSPFRAKAEDLKWILPLSAATATSIAFDQDAMNKLGHNADCERISRHISDAGGIYFPIAGSIGMYLIGSATHHDRLRETGVLSTEALIDATIVTEAVKLATQRERPDSGELEGHFWPHGIHNAGFGTSFPSAHAAAAWSVARVIGDEYPGWLSRLAVYGLASTVSVTRVTARKHFPSDVLVGSTFGYLIGGYVYHHHASHDENATWSFSPIYDSGSRSYGMGFEIDPAKLAIWHK
jgi:hypothetical protein